MFVPPSVGGALKNKLEEVEQNLSWDSKWRPKLVEKSGTPLCVIFRSKIPIREGCPVVGGCKFCDSDAVKCSVKGAVYQAVCLECLDIDEKNSASPKYIGESARPLRMRVTEHFNKLEEMKMDSFMFVEG